jgi:hypothetical protein
MDPNELKVNILWAKVDVRATKRALANIEADICTGYFSDKQRLELEKRAEELRNMLSNSMEKRDELMGLQIECKTPKESKPPLECKKPETEWPPLE